jgi:hypothetical protein
MEDVFVAVKASKIKNRKVPQDASLAFRGRNALAGIFRISSAKRNRPFNLIRKFLLSNQPARPCRGSVTFGTNLVAEFTCGTLNVGKSLLGKSVIAEVYPVL